MAKRVKFPLKLKNNVLVRTMDELRDNFDLEKIIEYLLNGRLIIWLEDRYCNDEAERLSALSKDDADFCEKICEIFGVEADAAEGINADEIERRNKKISELKQTVADEEIIENADLVAFDQDELEKIAATDTEIIYLYDGEYVIPLERENVTYIGIKSVTAVINSDAKVPFTRMNVKFKHIEFNEEYKDSIHTVSYGKVYYDGIYSDRNGKLKKREDSNFNGIHFPRNIQSEITDISVRDNNIVCVGKNGELYTNTNSKKDIKVPVNQTIIASSIKQYFLSTDGSVYRWYDGNVTKLTNDNIVQIAYTYSEGIFKLDGDGNVYMGQECLIKHEPNEETKIIKIVPINNEGLFALYDDGRVLRYKDGKRTIRNDLPDIVDIVPGTSDAKLVFALDAAGKVRIIYNSLSTNPDIDKLPPIKRLIGYGLIGVDYDSRIWEINISKPAVTETPYYGLSNILASSIIKVAMSTTMSAANGSNDNKGTIQICHSVIAGLYDANGGI